MNSFLNRSSLWVETCLRALLSLEIDFEVKLLTAWLYKSTWPVSVVACVTITIAAHKYVKYSATAVIIGSHDLITFAPWITKKLMVKTQEECISNIVWNYLSCSNFAALLLWKKKDKRKFSSLCERTSS